jgi:hypothetical protein
MLWTRVASGEIGWQGLTRVLSKILPLVSTTATSQIAPGRSVVSQSITTARWGDSMVRAQVTAWSERRSQGGAVVVVITGSSSRRVVVVSTADHTDTDVYVPLFWRLIARAVALPDQSNHLRSLHR